MTFFLRSIFIRLCLVVLLICLSGIRSQAAGNPESMIGEGVTQFNEGQFSESARIFSEFLTTFADQEERNKAGFAKVRVMLVRSHLQQKNWDELVEIGNVFLDRLQGVRPDWHEEVLFWVGYAEAQRKASEEAFKRLSQFVATFPNSQRFPLVVLLAAQSLIEKNDWKKTAEFLEEVLPRLPAPEYGLALNLALQARLESEQLDEAQKLIKGQVGRLSDNAGFVQYQLLLLELGSRLIDDGKKGESARILSNIPSQLEIETEQTVRLSAVRRHLERMPAESGFAPRKTTAEMVINQIEESMKRLQEVANFDSVVQFRIASAFLSMERYWETAIVLERMLKTLPPNEIVEQGTLTLVQCWNELGWKGRVLTTTAEFEKRFPKSKFLPQILFMRGKTLQGLLRYEEAQPAFQAIVSDHAESDLAPEALFELGYNSLLMGQTKQGVAFFEEVREKYPKTNAEQLAHFWLGEALSMDKQYEDSRRVHADYLAANPDAELAADAAYRRAFSAHSMEDFETSIAELREFVKVHRSSVNRPQAEFLLGDGLLATGETEAGIEILKAVPRSDMSAFTEAWFKAGKAYEAALTPEKVRAHFEQFVQEHPQSPKVAEAVVHIGRSHADLEKAREIYWRTVDELGDNPAQWSMVALLENLQKQYRGEEMTTDFLPKLRQLQKHADQNNKRAMSLLLRHAEGMLLQKTEMKKSLTVLVSAAPFIDPKVDNPEIMIDVADALRESGDYKEALALYRNTRRWNPRTIYLDRVFLGLGLTALAQKNYEEAIGYFDQFQNKSTGSLREAEAFVGLGDALVGLARFEEAEKRYLEALDNKKADVRVKAEALLRIGDIHMKMDNPTRAFPHYQRVYLIYGKWPEKRAAGYLRSGIALEKLGRDLEAARTYQEMLAIEELGELDEAREARERLTKLPSPPPANLEGEES